MDWRIAIVVIGLAFHSCDKNAQQECPPRESVSATEARRDTITLSGGKEAVVVYRGNCQYDTLVIEGASSNVIMGFGTSTIFRWDLQNAFPTRKMKKAGYRGLLISELLLLTDTIRKVNPKQLLLYAGSNDVLAKKSTAEVTGELEGLMAKIWDENPEIHITYITIHPSEGAFKVRATITGEPGIQTIESVNSNIITWIAGTHDYHASVIDSYDSFLAWDPKRIDTKYFEADKLHLNQEYGYPLLNRLTAPELK